MYLVLRLATPLGIILMTNVYSRWSGDTQTDSTLSVLPSIIFVYTTNEKFIINFDRILQPWIA